MDIKSIDCKTKAAAVLVGGVSSGWNSFGDRGAMHVSRAENAHIWDVDGHEFIDFGMGWGSLFLGHNHPLMKQTMIQAAEIGFGMQYETEYHIRLAQLLTEIIPCADKVRITNTGTESTMFAIRMARTYTGKEKIIKFEGHFHGVHDYLNFSNDVPMHLGKRGINGAIESLPGSAGIPGDIAQYVITLPYNDIDSLDRVLDAEKDNIAGIILEPICLASAIMYPQEGFLQILRDRCDENKIILIFDEVMSGFRQNLGGAQAYFGVTPDVATFSKILGCGFAISAIAGKKRYMDVLDPVGPCVASGTNSGRFLGVLGSLNALNYLKDNTDTIYDYNNANSGYFTNSVNNILAMRHVPGVAKGYGGRIVIHFGADKLPDQYEGITFTWNKEYHMKCYHRAIEKRLFSFLLPLTICPEPITLTPAHTREDIDTALERFEQIIKETPYTA